MEKLWGGRFQKNTSELMEDFNSSIGFDCKLYHYDIMGSIAHVRMLGETGIIDNEEAKLIEDTLIAIEEDIESGKVQFTKKHEDIHMNIEWLLTERIGETGKKLHTARSRNDQVALDVRLYARDNMLIIKQLIKEWISTLIDVASKNCDTIMPGYTHLQRAQPVTLAHHLMAYVEMAVRDLKRVCFWLDIHNEMPLGAGALAGTTFPIDREYVSDYLEFKRPTQNSLDSVSDRDFIIDALSNASVSMMHLSRLCEEIILWSSQEFDFVELDDRYSTGSSMMPQKKNPDAAELVRGKTGRVYGNLFTILTVMKSLPLAYNKDMQEDKECLFDGIETWQKCLSIMIPMMKTMVFKKTNMRNAAKGGFTNATDLADYLTKKGIAFRDSHKITGEIVFYCIEKEISLDELSIGEYKKFSELIDNDIYEFISISNCVSSRKSQGAPNSEMVKLHIENVKKFIETV